MKKLPQVVDAVTMIGMVMGVDDCVDPPDVGCKQLLPQVRAGIDEDPVSVGLHHYRRPGPAVPGVQRVTYAPVVADPWHTRRRAAAKQPHLHKPIGSGHCALPNRRSEEPNSELQSLIRLSYA